MPKDNTAYGPSSNPSSKSYAGGGGGGVSSGKTTTNTNSGSIRDGSPLASLSRLATAPPTTGVTTGQTIYGNTAYGPSGGMATGYATRSGPISGMGPSVGTYSNFRNLDGSAAIPGAGNMTAMGRNAFQARSQLQRNFGGPPRVGGLLSGEEVSVAPIPAPRRIVPTAAPISPGLSFFYNNALMPGAYPGMWQRDPTAWRRTDVRPTMHWDSLSYRYNNQLAPGTYPGMFQRDPTAWRRNETRPTLDRNAINPPGMPAATGVETIR